MVDMKLLALILRNPSCNEPYCIDRLAASSKKSVSERQLLEKVITDGPILATSSTSGYVHGDIRGVNIAARQTQRLLVPVRSALGWYVIWQVSSS
ncbi:hypothetical protein CY34DRAFT_805856 [Suillus luteus UH-Slu-Lm8-n1]|uniref:Uncharacterized protein n=1 Tax=Suillus luteus UH-Slu-Lm8-n1 TaxID=930992 RepID=A0A0D0AIC7_9AGAM|nr:hypothetical protein CY34DRAFT_805856 [Suillus luteus UH-Slu-Lm8-n1]